MKQQDKHSAKAHDYFFAYIFSHLPQVRNFLQGVLPSDLFQHLELDTLQALPQTFVDKVLQGSISDVVYSCRYKSQSIKLAFILEHKSFVPVYPHLQLLRYMLNLWEYQQRQDKSLSRIVPILVYHGRGNFPHKLFQQYFPPGGSMLDACLPAFEYVLVDLKRENEEQIRKRFSDQILQNSLLLMKYIFSPDLVRRLDSILSDIENLGYYPKYRIFLHTIMVYLNKTQSKNQDVMDRMQKIYDFFQVDFDEPYGQMIYTQWEKLHGAKVEDKVKAEVKEQVIAEVKEQVLQEVTEQIKAEERKATIINLAHKGYSTGEIANIFDLTTDEVSDLILNNGNG